MFEAVKDALFDLLSWSKRHWALTLASLLSTALIVLWIALDRASTEVATAFLVVIPATLYYTYSEIINQPSVVIREENSEFVLAAMDAPQESIQRIQNLGSLTVGPDTGASIDTETLRPDLERMEGTELPISIRSPVIRPVVFYIIDVENLGKATAENSMVQVRLKRKSEEIGFYGRWTDPESSQRYDLLPSQDHGVFVAKVYLTNDFYPGFGILNTHDYDHDLQREHIPIHLSARSAEGPGGVIRYLPEIRSDDFEPRVYIPREKRSDEPGQSGSTSWIGNELGSSRHDRFSVMEPQEYTIEARVIAENYRSHWKEIDCLVFPDDIVRACVEKENWHDRWDDHFLQFLEENLEDAIDGWLSERSTESSSDQSDRL